MKKEREKKNVESKMRRDENKKKEDEGFFWVHQVARWVSHASHVLTGMKNLWRLHKPVE